MNTFDVGERRRLPARSLALALAVAFAGLFFFARTEQANAAPVNVTVTVLRFIQVQNPDPQVGQGCCGDYYASVNINGAGFEDSGSIDDQADISPYWRFTKSVDDSLGTIPIKIRIWDDDTVLTAPDDIMDINPTDGVQTLTVNFDLHNGTWSGDVPANVGFSAGDGDKDHFEFPTEGGEAGKVLFDISLSGNGDTDGDGIPDGVERFGVRDGNGNVVADMAAMGADPCRKTIAVEVDWMADAAHSHRPTDDAVNDVVGAFDRAPVDATTPCPYFGFPKKPKGVDLIVDRSNSIAEQAVFIPANSSLDSSLKAVRDSGNFNAARRPYFHYVLFVHDQTAGSSSSGLCCVDNRDFIISLGSWKNQVGTFRDQAGSLMHELGHSLGLGHGGDEGLNYKPNYLSDMNYFFDPTGIPDSTIPANIDTDDDGVADQSFRLDYSRSKLPDLVKASLQEPAGIGDGTDFTKWFDPSYNVQTSAGNQPVNWNWNFTTPTFTNPAMPFIDASPVAVDVNLDSCVGPGGNGTIETAPANDDKAATQVGTGPVIAAGPDFVCDTAKTGDDTQDLPVGTNVTTAPGIGTLHGYDDWANIKYRGALSPTAGGAAVQHGPDMTFEQAQLMEQATYADFSPDFDLQKAVDHADAAPGDTLTYTLTAHNGGTGAGQSIDAADTLPDGSVAHRSFDMLVAGASQQKTLTYDVPCSTADLTKLTNSATVSGTNLLNNPEVNTSNNTASVTTTVHAPVLTLAKTASSSVNAGGAITYRLSYENTGSGDANSVAITDTLPADVYYSTALDLGAGPAPGSVTHNANGTTTLTWTIGSVTGGSGPNTIEYTARPSLLFLGGSSVANGAKVTFTNANGCTYTPVTASGSTGITVVPPTRNPLSMGYWKTHPAEWTSEILARIQATDQRYDGADGSSPDGKLSSAEVTAAFAANGTSPGTLQAQLLGTYFNLATRRINAGTAIDSKTDRRLALHNVRDAALYSIATLAMPLGGHANRYTDAITVLEEINLNKSEIY